MQVLNFNITIDPNNQDQNFLLMPIPPECSLKVLGASIGFTNMGIWEIPQGENGFTSGIALGYNIVSLDPSANMAFMPIRMFQDQTEEAIHAPAKLDGMQFPGMPSVVPGRSWLQIHLGTNQLAADPVEAVVVVIVE